MSSIRTSHGTPGARAATAARMAVDNDRHRCAKFRGHGNHDEVWADAYTENPTSRQVGRDLARACPGSGRPHRGLRERQALLHPRRYSHRFRYRLSGAVDCSSCWSLHTARLIVLVVTRKIDVVDADIDLGDFQSGHPFQGRHDVSADARGEVDDRNAVLNDDIEIDRRLTLADLDADALTDVGSGGPWDALTQRAERAGAARTEVVYAGDFAGRDAGNLADDRIRN